MLPLLILKTSSAIHTNINALENAFSTYSSWRVWPFVKNECFATCEWHVKIPFLHQIISRFFAFFQLAKLQLAHRRQQGRATFFFNHMLFEVRCETKQKVTSSLLSKGDKHEYNARANCFSFMQRIQSSFEFKPGFHASLIQASMKLSWNCVGFTKFKYMRSTTTFKGSSRLESVAQACTAIATSCFLSSPTMRFTPFPLES